MFARTSCRRDRPPDCPRRTRIAAQTGSRGRLPLRACAPPFCSAKIPYKLGVIGVFAPFNVGARIARPRKEFCSNKRTTRRLRHVAPTGSCAADKLGFSGSMYFVGRGLAPAAMKGRLLLERRHQGTALRDCASPTNQNLPPQRGAPWAPLLCSLIRVRDRIR